MSTSVSNIKLWQQSGEGRTKKLDLLAVEEPLEIRLGFGVEGERSQQSLSVTMRTPGHDFEVALGFLFTERIIQSFDDVESIKHCEDVGKESQKGNVVRVELKPHVQIDFQKLQRNFYTTSSCGVCGKSSIDSVKVDCRTITSSLVIPITTINKLPETLRKSQLVFEHTGGLHASALFDDEGNLKILREDVGRHNALDKVIGAMLFKEQLPLSSSILLVSGRASFELVQKAVVAGIPIMAAVGAPSSLAVELAQSVNMTLLGFVRDGRFNIYCGEERIVQ